MLTVDLTNRCNMMCDPCFMDANQVGYVHELQWEDIQKILDDAMSIKPRRQMSVQFSGGEPTLSPYFLDAIRYARKIGYFAVQCATNGLRFAEEPGFAKQGQGGRACAWRTCSSTASATKPNAHRKIGNLFDVKLRAIEELARGGHRRHPRRHRRQRREQRPGRQDPAVRHREPGQDHGRLVPARVVHRAATRTSTTRRARSSATRCRTSPTTCKAQTGVTEPMRDWFPLSALGPFSDLVDQLMGERADWGAMKCGCHPNCGIGTVLMVNKRTRQIVPLTQFLDMEGLLDDIGTITDGAQAQGADGGASWRWRWPRTIGRSRRRPATTSCELLKQLLSQTGARGKKIGEYESRRRTSSSGACCSSPACGSRISSTTTSAAPRCASFPYGTQMGEI